MFALFALCDDAYQRASVCAQLERLVLLQRWALLETSKFLCFRLKECGCPLPPGDRESGMEATKRKVEIRSLEAVKREQGEHEQQKHSL